MNLIQLIQIRRFFRLLHKDKVLQRSGSKLPNREKESSINIYSRTSQITKQGRCSRYRRFGEGDAYTATLSNYENPSMIVSSSIIGLIGIAIAYLIAIPLGSYMALLKNTWFDSASNSCLDIYDGPSNDCLGLHRPLGWFFYRSSRFLPSLRRSGVGALMSSFCDLGTLSAPGLAVWIRRYMIDLHSQDFVRFARAKGLSEKKFHANISSRMPWFQLLQGFLFNWSWFISGATLTETVFAFPGMGKMLIDSIKASNNTMVVVLSSSSLFLLYFGAMAGDILMVMVDPRIKLTTKKGGKIMSTIDKRNSNLLNVTTLPLKQLMRRLTPTGNQYFVNF